MPYQGIRLRRGAKIKQLNFSKEDIKKVSELMSHRDPSSLPLSSHHRREESKRILGTSLCSVCYGIPTVQVTYDVSDHDLKASRRETYCDNCLRQVYERISAGEPEDSSKAAEFYGCVRGEIPRVSHEEYLEREYIKTRKGR